MALPSFAISDDEELERYARDKTSYDSNQDELPGSYNDGQMEGLIHDAKRQLYARTGSDSFYGDTAYGQALLSLLAMKMKGAVENINISSYGIGDESVSFNNADPEDSQQLQQWSSEVNEMLDKSSVGFPNEQDQGLSNTGALIG